MSGGYYPPPHPPAAPPANPSMMMPPMPPPWAPMYAAWYSQWYYTTHGGYAPHFAGPPPAAPPAAPVAPPPPVPGSDQPPPPGFDDDSAEPPPLKKSHLDLAGPPPPPPEDKTPSWQAAKKGAVIYKTPRPPTPEPPKPAPEPVKPVVLEPPKLVENIQLAGPKKWQWFHDGETWVYAKEPPEMKPPKPPEEWPEFKYSSARAEDPVGKAFMANMKGKYIKHDKPKAVPVRCDVCSLTVSCQATYESHIAGKPHRKRAAQTEKVQQLQEKVTQVNNPESMNSSPGHERPNNPLQSQPNGDIYCTVCDCTMNSGAVAQSHIAGVKHRTKIERSMRSFRGRGRGFGPGRGFGRGGGGPRMFVPPLERPELVCDETEANEEYERVFNEALADNIDVEEATSRAEAAKQAALSVLVPVGNEAQTPSTSKVQYIPQIEDEDDEEDEDNVMIGIDIITAPNGATSGTYRCNCCGVMMTSEENLKIHLETAAHQMYIEGRKKAIRQMKAAKQAAPSQRGSSSRGRVYRGRANANQEGSMKAQRGRRGLISYGEVMPDKLTKGQKKAQPKDIAELLARKSAEVGISAGVGEIKKVAPLLMNFVRGGVMEGNQ